MSKASWDQIRRQVRTFRALVQSQPPATTLATIKDFCFDDETNRLYFLANDPSKSGGASKSLMLYEIDLSDFDRETGPAPIPSSEPTDLSSMATSGPDHVTRQIHPLKPSGKNTPASFGSITSTSSLSSSSSSSSTKNAPTSTSSLIVVDSTFLATITALPSAPWRPLFFDGWMYDLEKLDTTVSREEQLAKERKRVANQGITCYQFDAGTGRVLFAYGGSVYVGSVGKTGDYMPYQVRPAFSFFPSSTFSSSPPKGLFSSHRPHTFSDSTTPSSPSPFTRLSSSPPASDLQSPPFSAMISPRIDPKLGGRNGDLIAFVRNRDIWVSTLSGRETQLTFCSHNLDDGTLSCGVAEFVMQEEFHRFTGYHWDPTRDSSSPHSSLDVDRILYLEVSESMVDVVLIPRPGAAPTSTAECEEYRYPRAGTANATSDLQIVEFRVLEDREAGGPDRMGGRGSTECGPVRKRLWAGDSLRELFPWMEYVVRFGWFPDGRYVWAQVLSRMQNRTAVVKIPAGRFMSAREHWEEEGYGEVSDEDDEEDEEGEGPDSDIVEGMRGDRSPRGGTTMDGDGDIEMREGEAGFGRRKSRGKAGERGAKRAKRRMTVRLEERISGYGKGEEEGPRKREGRSIERIEVLWDETTEAWINVTDLYHFFPTEDLPIDFSSSSNNPPLAFTRFLWASERTGHRHLYLVTKRSDQPAHIRPITWGDWSVIDRPIYVDDVRKLVYFVGKRDTPLECHLYVAAYGGDDGNVDVKSVCPVRRLTALGYNHHVVMDGRCEKFVDWFSSTECPPVGVVWWLEFEGKEGKEEEEKEEEVVGDGEGVGTGTKDTRRKRALKDEVDMYANENLDKITRKTTKDPLPRVMRHRGIVIRDPSKAIAAVRGGSAVDDYVGIAAAPASPTTGPTYPSSAPAGTRPGTRLGTLWGGSTLAATLGKQGGEAAGEAAGINTRDSTGTIGGAEERAGGVGNRNGNTNADESGVDSVDVGVGAVAEGTKMPTEEFFDFVNSDGVKIYGCLYKPYDYVPGKSYPTLLSIYGGPKSQMVTNDYKFPRFLRFFLALRLGFAVVLIDSRGSSDRGTYFEAYLRHRMGTVELVDQIEGLRHIAAARVGAIPAAPEAEPVSVIDLDRIAITGWSYGGYLSLMAIAQYPEMFKIAIAGAPVTQWELYDTAYTERYMGLPEENREGYRKGSVISWADKFPDGENRLLVVHGLIDENVHFKNTETFIAELIKHNKPHHLQVYPSERHGLRHASVNEHFETLMFFWLVNYL